MNRRMIIVVVTVSGLMAGTTQTLLLAQPAEAAASAGPAVTVTTTSAAGDRLTAEPNLTLAPLTGQPDVRVDATRQFQGIDGFGATFNEAGWATLNRPTVSAAQRDSVMSKLFSPSGA